MAWNLPRVMLQPTLRLLPGFLTMQPSPTQTRTVWGRPSHQHQHQRSKGSPAHISSDTLQSPSLLQLWLLLAARVLCVQVLSSLPCRC